MSTPRYLVAKYIPDLWRNEPQNIGVIVWSDQGVDALFLGEEENGSRIDGRSVPEYVNSPKAYRLWIAYWRHALKQATFAPAMGGMPVPRTSPEFLDALISTSRDNYQLVDGGFVLDPVEELADLREDLFRHLVREEKDPSERDLKTQCFDLLQRSGLTRSPEFRTEYHLDYPLDHGEQGKATFHYAIANGSPKYLCQRIPLRRSGSALLTAIDANAWKLQHAREAYHLSIESTSVLVNIESSKINSTEMAHALAPLRAVTRILNIKDTDTTLAEFARIQKDVLQ